MSAEEAVLAIESILDLPDRSYDDPDSVFEARCLAARLELRDRALATLRAVLGMPSQSTVDQDPEEAAEEYMRMIFAEHTRPPRRRRSRIPDGSQPDPAVGGNGGAGASACVAPLGNPVDVLHDAVTV